MGRIYITGDCHGNFDKFGVRKFPEQKELTHEDFVIICGDFGGVWSDDPEERYRLDWLNKKNFTTLFVDGNHENFDRLLSDEFETVDFHGGEAHRIRENIYHLKRGYVFNICGKKIFTFGGASSHDINDGILEPSQYSSRRSLIKEYNRLTRLGKILRINHISWWKEEMPNEYEMKFGLKKLGEAENEVDFIVTHCAPQHIASEISLGRYKPDNLTLYFNKVAEQTNFSKWFFGHYHKDMAVTDKYIMLYHDVVRIV